ncbi:MAG TPA: DUF4259 domain-containing protein [Myxococcaceae bacterium]|jgi:hypothetical protein
MWGKTWLSKLEADDPAPVERALDDVTRSPAGQPLDRDVLRRALAASEVVAASGGKAAEELPAAARSLAERCADRLRPLRAKARGALERIRSRPAGEIDARDVYDEPDGATEQAERDDRDWRTQMDLLSMRLSD